MPLSILGVSVSIIPMEVTVDMEQGMISLSFHPTDDINDVHFPTLPNTDL